MDLFKTFSILEIFNYLLVCPDEFCLLRCVESNYNVVYDGTVNATANATVYATVSDATAVNLQGCININVPSSQLFDRKG